MAALGACFGREMDDDSEDFHAVGPIMNDYKWKTFSSRFMETVFAGMKFGGVPFKLWPLQILLFMIPFGFYVVMVHVLNPDSTETRLVLSCVIGGFTFLYGCLIQIPRVKMGDASGNNMLADALKFGGYDEDEDVEVETCFSMQSYEIMFAHRSKGQLAIHIVGAALTSALAGWIFTPKSIKIGAGLGEDKEALATVLACLGWFIFSMALYPAIVRDPPEPNQYRAYAIPWTVGLHRCFHCIVFFIVDLILTETSLAKGLFQKVIFFFFPLFWWMGTLPQVDVFFLWAFEVLLVVLMGGTPAATDTRLVILLILALIRTTVVEVIYIYCNPISAILAALAAGLVLCTDYDFVFVLASRVLPGKKIQPTRKIDNPSLLKGTKTEQALTPLEELKVGASRGDDVPQIGERPKDSVANTSVTPVHPPLYPLEDIFDTLTKINRIPPARREKSFQVRTIIEILVVVLLVVGAICIGFAIKDTGPLVDVQPVRDLSDALLSTILVLQLITSLGQRVYLWGFIRNPIYSTSVRGTRKKLGLAYPFMIAIGIVLASVHVTLFYEWNPNQSTVAKVMEGILVARFGQWLWTQPFKALFSLTITTWISRAEITTWEELGLFLRLWIVYLIMDRFQRFLGRLHFWITGTWTVLTTPSHQFKGCCAIMTIMIIFSPIILCIIIIATIGGMPLLPLFGLPIFILTFPRPAKMWPIDEVRFSASPDSKLFSPVFNSLKQTLTKIHQEGTIPMVAERFYLLRHDQYMVMIEVAESTSKYAICLLKALELQMTSCHTVESNRIDEVFEAAFEGPGTCVNPYFTHCLTPTAEIVIESYEISDVTLTGIFDHPDVLRQIPPMFAKCMIWILHRIREKKLLPDPKTVQGFDTGLADSSPTTKIPWEWYENVTGRPEQASQNSDPEVKILTTILCTLEVTSLAHVGLSTILSWFNGWEGEENGPLSKHPLLIQGIAHALRYAVRLVFEEVVYQTPIDNTELREKLLEFQNEWFLGPQHSQGWTRSLENLVPNLFTVVKDEGIYRAKTLTLGHAKWQCGYLNAEVVRGYWAAVNLELLFMTNDDDERYSIQAHKTLLRNIFTHAAEPPLGYPLLTELAKIPYKQ